MLKHLSKLVILALSLSNIAFCLSLRNFREINQAESFATGVLGDPLLVKKVTPRLPQSGRISEYTPASQMALATLASDYCNRRWQADSDLPAEQRLFYSEIDYSQGVSQLHGAKLETLLRKLGQQFWQRDLETEELSLLNLYAAELISSGESLQNATLLICTLFGTSPAVSLFPEEKNG